MTRFLAAIVFAGACASHPGSTDEPPLDPAPPDGGQQLATDSYTLSPGAETYMCYQFYSPDDAVAITKVDSLSEIGIHHLVLYQALGTLEPDEPHECEVLIKTSWIPIFASGTGSHTMTLPDTAGMVIQPHTQYVMQIHLQNTTDSDLQIRAGINLTYQHDTTNVIPAGLYALGTFQLEIPPATADFTKTIDCTPGRTMNVFTVFPHMHKIGTKLEVTRDVVGAAPAQPFYTIDPWTFGNQPMDPLITTIGPTDTLHATCHYDNPGDSAVVYGESSDNEMCFFVMFYYPFTGLDGCVNS